MAEYMRDKGLQALSTFLLLLMTSQKLALGTEAPVMVPSGIGCFGLLSVLAVSMAASCLSCVYLLNGIFPALLMAAQWSAGK